MVREHPAVDGDYPLNNYPLAMSDFAAYVEELAAEAAGVDLPPLVPAQQTWLVISDGEEVVGELRFRPRLANVPPNSKTGVSAIIYVHRSAVRGGGPKSSV